MPIQVIKTIFICPAHNENYLARKEHMENLLTVINLRVFNIINLEHKTTPNIY